MKTLGVIGGLGPMATAYFMQLVIEMTKAEIDQEHVEMIIYNCPSVPDRTGYILGQTTENPAKKMIEIGNNLAKDGADLLAIPCVTANYFYEELTANIEVPIIDIIKETARHLKENNISTVGLMATDGTISSRLFQKVLEKENISVICPDEEGQKDVMHLIYDNVKANKPIDMLRFQRVSEGLFAQGAQVIVLGCTELSMIRRDEKIGPGYLDAMQVLAKASVEACAELKEHYHTLITK